MQSPNPTANKEDNFDHAMPKLSTCGDMYINKSVLAEADSLSAEHSARLLEFIDSVVPFTLLRNWHA